MEKRLELMKEKLMSCVEMNMMNLDEVDAKELGEAIDMIKDIEEALYYCTVTKAMKEYDEDDEGGKHYSSRTRYPVVYNRDMDRGMGRMYYENPEYMSGGRMQYSNGNGGSNSSSGNSSSSSGNGNGNSRMYGGMEYNLMRDSREGRSPITRKMYMEHKETHADKATQMRELEAYMQELTQDIFEMIEGASQEEKQYLNKKIAALASKIT